MKIRALFFCLGAWIFSISLFAADQGSSLTLRQFRSDKCTFFYQGPVSKRDLWTHCCFEHDLFYWAGGTKKQRLNADLNLKQCIADTGYSGIAEIVYIGVRTGRFSPITIEAHDWANAWAYDKRNYRKLRYHHITSEQVTLIANELSEYENVPFEMKMRLLESLIESE